MPNVQDADNTFTFLKRFDNEEQNAVDLAATSFRRAIVKETTHFNIVLIALRSDRMNTRQRR